jgi:hypothetical protein
MDAPSQNMNALSVQSLYYASDDALHEIDLQLLSRLPETLRLLQEQLRQLARPEGELEVEVETVVAPSFSRRVPSAAPAVVG